MSLITKNQLSLVLQSIKTLLSFKANKDEVVHKNELTEYNAIAIAMETGLLPGGIPVAEDGKIYTDEKGVIYTL